LATVPETSDLAIFGRIIRTDRGDLPRSVARYVLTLDFPEADKARMHQLAVDNQAGALTASEQEVLANYVRAGHLLALLQSKARKSLRRKLPRADRG
jgi:hypothetical protein